MQFVSTCSFCDQQVASPINPEAWAAIQTEHIAKCSANVKRKIHKLKSVRLLLRRTVNGKGGMESVKKALEMLNVEKL